MQPSPIRTAHADVSRGGSRQGHVARIDNGVVAYCERVFGVPVARSETLDAFARWAYKHAGLSNPRPGRLMKEPRKKAVIYRMVMKDHICPFGLKSLDLLEREGYEVEDHWLKTREETERFQRDHGVDTTPQTFIDGRCVGGNDHLRRFFGKPAKDPKAISYTPVIAVFAMTALMAMAAGYAAGTLFAFRTVEWFISFSMCVLAILKLRDLEGFSNMFLGYDLLARRWVRYAYLYPFGEAFAGVLMIAGGAFGLVAAPVALFIGAVGAWSVVRAVYVEKRELKCACVGGDSNVPLGFISLTENLMMVAMAIWMIAKAALT